MEHVWIASWCGRTLPTVGVTILRQMGLSCIKMLANHRPVSKSVSSIPPSRLLLFLAGASALTSLWHEKSLEKKFSLKYFKPEEQEVRGHSELPNQAQGASFWWLPPQWRTGCRSLGFRVDSGICSKRRAVLTQGLFPWGEEPVSIPSSPSSTSSFLSGFLSRDYDTPTSPHPPLTRGLKAPSMPPSP